MASIPPVFGVREPGERTVVSFLDWQSAAGTFYRSDTAVFADEARKQLESLVAEHHCKVLAFDMSPVDLLPSACLGLLVALSQTDLEIELLHPSAAVRSSLAVSQLDQFFTIRD